MASRPLLREDLDHILEHAASAWRELQGARLFITGGTGFFGRWIVESIAQANDHLGCRIQATVLSRDPARFLGDMAHMAGRNEFCWLQGEPARFELPRESHDFILHMATATSAHAGKTQPLAMLEAKFASALRIIEFARHCGARRLLLTSSGAVYGPQPSHIDHISEDYAGAPDPCNPASAYGEGKRLVELLCNLDPDIGCVTARCFSFIGPHLPLDARFAAGNFLRDGLKGGPIILHGSGQSIRSYLHAADLTIWLLTLLTAGRSGRAYNVGSEEAVTTLELAELISRKLPGQVEVDFSQPAHHTPQSRYVPCIGRARQELDLQVRIGLDEAINRTLSWHVGK